MSTAVKIWLSSILMLVGIYGSYTLVRALHRPESSLTLSTVTPSAPTRELDEFTFTDSHGKTFALKDLKGRVWVASFFFADCPGFCTRMNQKVYAMQQELADLGVKIVSISVDPTNDTPERLTEYAKKFAADPNDWVFLTGPFQDSHDLGQGVFKVTVLGRDHSDRLIVVDREGKVRGQYSSLDDAQFDAFKKKIHEVAAEPAPTPGDDEVRAEAPAAPATQPATAEESP